MSAAKTRAVHAVSITESRLERVRADFPALHQQVRGKPLVYLDNAATTQKPEAVIQAIEHYYRWDNANVHRGVHTLSERATAAFEGARDRLRAFLNARSTRELIFVRGATEGINLVAQSWGRSSLREGDEILVSEMEHHSNIVPWQMVCEQTGAKLRVIPINERGELVLEEYERLLGPRTRLVAVSHCSNALGSINPVQYMIERAHSAGALVLVDGAQAVPHMRVDLQALDCDFYVLSGHKMYGPTGIGVLYGKEALLEAMPPYHGGGEMIKYVTFDRVIYNDLPYKFEAGTPNIAGVIGLGVAAEYISRIGLDVIAAYEQELLDYATQAAAEVPGMRIIGTAREKAAILSFALKGVHPHDVGTIMDSEGIAIRTGHHCAMPVMQRFRVPATARASFAFYNTPEEVDALMRGIGKVIEVFK